MEIKNKSISIKSAVCSLPSVDSPCPRRRQAAAFTLIELLVAMGILMVIVLMMANLFQQSTRAWDAGMRQAEAGLEARAVIGMIQQELSQAVANPDWPFSSSSSGSLDFYTLGDLSSTNTVEPQRVRYSRSGKLQKTAGGKTIDLLNVAAFTVDTSFGPDLGGSTNLPDWVEIGLELSDDSDFSTVRVYVQGREYEEGSADWIDTHRGN